MIQLPHKLSELAQMALDDVEAVERMPQYRVTMSLWHQPSGDTCSVCAAGAVMANRLNVSDSDSLVHANEFSERFGEHNARALLAIDSLRSGDVGEALSTLADGYESWRNGRGIHHLDRSIEYYSDDSHCDCDECSGSGDTWHEDMVKLIADLRAAGL